MILIVDDNKSNIQALSALLNQEHYRSVAALNGKMALEMLERVSPQLILLDINMPGMNGFELAEKIKSKEEHAETPIIFISAMDDLSSKLKAFSHKGVDYITKPFESAEVLARVKTQLELYRLRQATLEQAREMEQFAYMAAHDLKSPANVIESYCNLLKGGQVELSEGILDRLKGASSNLRGLIDSLLDLSSIRERPPVEEEHPLEPHLLAAKLRGRGHFPGVELTLENKLEENGRWPMTEVHLDLLFTNLVLNAFKYRKHEGSLRLRLTSRQEGGWHFLDIEDDGRGIPVEHRVKVFDSFHRVPQEDQVQGHGLGLSICKKILESYGGRIEVLDSSLGGARFLLRIPVGKRADAT